MVGSNVRQPHYIRRAEQGCQHGLTVVGFELLMAAGGACVGAKRGRHRGLGLRNLSG
jgi:hypothetical protein